MRKKIVELLVCMLLVGTFFVITLETVPADQEGDYTYTVSNEEAIITGYTGLGGAIIIPSTLGGYPTVHIGDNAFNTYNGHLLTSVIIPDSVSTIGENAFRLCTDLTAVTIGSGLTVIGANMLRDCSSLTSLTFLGLVAPTTVEENWIAGTHNSLRGHAYAASDFPAPEESWHGLTMGAYISENDPPVFETPSPTNGSTANPVSLTWSITINDPDADHFNWTIQCSNGENICGTDDTNGTKSLPLSDLAYLTTYRVWVNATDPDGSGLYTKEWFEFTTIEQGNTPPDYGTPSPTNGSTANPVSLTWSITIDDPDADHFNWTIQCSNGENICGTDDTNGTKSLPLSGLAYSTTYTVWVNATDTTGSNQTTRKWYTFTTTNPDGGGGGGTSTENTKPVANASAGEPYRGFVNETIPFDGSSSYDPDGLITEWFWDFGDNSNGTGEIVQHTYSYTGTYNVTLTVTDDQGATDTTTTTCVITSPTNRPPTIHTITGPTTGTTNTTYTYTVLATDPDNDTICYSIIWGDQTSYDTTSIFLPSGTPFTCSHHYTTPGQYIIRVSVTDNQTETFSQLTIDIEAEKTDVSITQGFDFVVLIGVVIAAVVCGVIAIVVLRTKGYF